MPERKVVSLSKDNQKKIDNGCKSRMETRWAIVYFRLFSENYRSRLQFWGYFFHD
jgi:hypothetical protein